MSSARAAVLSLIVFVSALPASAQVFESVGARALGMGGAFVAVADDATASYWNPAGLSMGAFFSLLVDHARRETGPDSPTSSSLAENGSSTFVGLSTNSLALTYYRLRVDRAAPPTSGGEAAALRTLTLHNAAVTGSQLLVPGLSVGSTLRYVRGSYGSGGSVSSPGSGGWIDQAAALSTHGQHKVDWDVGLKAGSRVVHVGLVARNLLQPTLKALDGSMIRLERQIRAGLAVRPADRLTVAADVDLSRHAVLGRDRRIVAVGAEHWFGDWLGVRGGVRVDLEASDREPAGALGVSISLTPGIFLDTHVTRGRDDTERGWGLAGRVGF